MGIGSLSPCLQPNRTGPTGVRVVDGISEKVGRARADPILGMLLTAGDQQRAARSGVHATAEATRRTRQLRDNVFKRQQPSPVGGTVSPSNFRVTAEELLKRSP